MVKRSAGERGDTPLHLAARSGNRELVLEIISKTSEEVELKEILAKQNHACETPLYVASEYGYVDMVEDMIKHYDIDTAGTRARNGFDAFHVATKQGNLGVLKVLMEALPELAMTVDLTNTTALHTAAAQGHVDVVNYLLDSFGSLANITRSNCKTALHSAARNGHLLVVKALLSKESGIAVKIDKKGQTALHMAVKGHNVELVTEMLKANHSLINMVDAKGNTSLHIASRKGRAEIVQLLLNHKGVDTTVINKDGESVLDTADRNGQPEIAAVLREHGIQSAKFIRPLSSTRSRELKQTVSVIKHEVHHQLEHTRQTRKQVRGMVKRLNKMHLEGLNNAINSTTVVAVLIATVAFAAIFQVPGLYPVDASKLTPNLSTGEVLVGPRIEFIIFFIFDSFALFLSLAVVIVQTSVVVVERKSKKKLMAIINKLMWLACVMVSVAFLALSYIVVGEHHRLLAIGVTGIGTVIMATTLGTMCYWVIVNRLQSSKLRRSLKRSMTNNSQSPQSWSVTIMSDTDILNSEYKTVYAL
ncbi:ankyrin repeat-containing protein At5g02620 [Cannabis sativa]|uniref:ankyrin repeat-containing protein At5g02620 n=1 Tax=Cannabis sativa TaxID=3483 RepID=UPI0029CA757E|nr:ankyrin repeat-containing protein At5g02620 [Cannabis sativa]XP_060967831.1 ankyrin repeat-containing protein At5g02620 [Cannabis sativa]